MNEDESGIDCPYCKKYCIHPSYDKMYTVFKCPECKNYIYLNYDEVIEDGDEYPIWTLEKVEGV